MIIGKVNKGKRVEVTAGKASVIAGYSKGRYGEEITYPVDCGIGAIPDLEIQIEGQPYSMVKVRSSHPKFVTVQVRPIDV